MAASAVRRTTNTNTDAFCITIPAETWEMMGCTLQEDGQYQSAIGRFLKAMRAPGATPLVKARLWNHIGASHFALGNLSQTVDSFYKASQLAPEYDNVRLKVQTAHDLAGALIYRGRVEDIDDAIYFLKSIIELPDVLNLLEGDVELLAKAYSDLAYALLFRNEEGDLAKAFEHVNNGLELMPTNPDTAAWLLSCLGDLYAGLDMTEKAERCFADASSLPNLSDDVLIVHLNVQHKRMLSKLILKTIAEIENPENSDQLSGLYLHLSHLLSKRKMEGDAELASTCMQKAVLAT